MRLIGSILVALLISGCSVSGKAILLSVEPATPLDERDLRNYCDLGDKAACALAASDESERPPAKFAIIQGIATPDRAVFSAIIPKELALSWFIYDRDLNRLWKLHDSRKQSIPGSEWFVQRVEARDLIPGRVYELLAGDKEGNLVEDRNFKTLSDDGELRFGIISDLKKLPDQVVNQRIANLIAANPKMVIFTGGNIDATMKAGKLPANRIEALSYFSGRHANARNRLAFARMRKLTPVVATWNDSEFGFSGGDRTFKFKDQAREAFEMFFPSWADEHSLENGPGVSKSIQFGTHLVVLLDERTFRFPDLCVPNKKKATVNAKCTETKSGLPNAVGRFGKIQMDWVYRQAANQNQTLWLISADPWLGLFHSQPMNFSSGLEWAAQLKSNPVFSALAETGCCTLVEVKPGEQFEFSRFTSEGNPLLFKALNVKELQSR